MTTTCSTHRPRLPAPLRSPEDALRALYLATDSGREPCAVLACVDGDRRPMSMFIVEECTGTPAELRTALSILIEAIDGKPSTLESVILASSRPDASEPSAADLDAWAGLHRKCEKAGLVLLDWFVLVGGTAYSIAELVDHTTVW